MDMRMCDKVSYVYEYMMEVSYVYEYMMDLQ